MTLRLALTLIGAAAVSALHAAEPDETAERQRIRTERAAIEAAFTERQRECAGRFVVASCIDAARQQQRVASSRLRVREVALDDAQRRRRAAQRLREIGSDQRPDADLGRSVTPATSPALPEDYRDAPTPRLGLPDNGSAAPVQPTRQRAATPTSRAVAVARRAEETRKWSAFEARQQALQARRRAVEQRNADRAAQGKVVAPLPLPPGASAPP